MPWTFAHAVAALPFWRLCPRYLSFPALAIGAIGPDLGYCVGQFRATSYAHTFMGSLIVCLPSGLLLVAILRAFRKPVCFLLPQPHREAIERLTEPLPFTALRAAIISFSLLVGAYIIWLRRHPAPPPADPTAAREVERKRWWLVAASVVATLAIAIPLALGVAIHDSGNFAFETFVFHGAVYAVTVFFPIFIGTALYFYSGRTQDR